MTIIRCSQCGAQNRVDEHASGTPVCGKCRAPLSLQNPHSDGKPLTVTDETFAQNVLRSQRPVILDLWAPWCRPCLMLAPMLEEIARESNGRYVVAKLNIDENPQVATRFHVDSIPTLIIFKNGVPVDRLVGLQPKQALQSRLASLN